MKTLLGGLVLLAACGSVDDNTHLPDAPRGDALPDDAAPDVDAAPTAPRCDPTKGFGTPIKVDELNTTASDLSARLSNDELTIVFSSTRAGGTGGTDLYTATRATKTDTWGTPSLLAGVNTANSEDHPSLTSDGLTIYFDQRVLGTNAPLQVMRATRSSTSQSFGTPTAVAIINAGGGDNGEPWVLPDQSSVYFSSTRNANNAADLYIASGTAGSFGTPTPVAGTQLVTTSNEGSPTLTPDQLTMYFRSDRVQNMDVWMATRTSAANGFGTPINIGAVNTTASEVPDWISADDCILYFHRDNGVAAPNLDIYRAEKPL